MNEPLQALEIRLRKTKPLAPPFHQHIARGKLVDRLWQKGDRVVVYEIVATVPDGPVLVTGETIIRFEGD